MNKQVMIPEEVEKSLIEIQNFCNEFVDCSECPLHFVKPDECFFISETPNNWNLKEVAGE